jgi:hypothetical protein
MDACAAIVGGGPAGLTQARALKRLGIPFTIYERNADFGGLWNRDDPASPVYESAHLISSRTMTGFEGFPMPDDWPDYPNGHRVLAYIRDFARAEGLYAHARFGASVARADQVDGGWSLTLADGTSAGHRWLIAANGSNWKPWSPTWPGSFDGVMRHSSDYSRPDELAGKRVLVVGLGNSGIDIACDAAPVAARVAVSIRRGYHIIPKHILGKPADVFAASGPPLPLPLRQRIFGLLLKVLVGDLSAYGMPKPDHRLMETHPLLNDLLPHYLRHGDIALKPDIDRLVGPDVVFADGSREGFDEVICATGFEWEVPYIDPTLLPWKRGRLAPPLAIFPDAANLFLISFVESNGSSFSLFNEMSSIIARAILAERDDPAAYARLRDVLAATPFDVTGRLHMVDSDRHVGYMDNATYRKALARFKRMMGWPAVEMA